MTNPENGLPSALTATDGRSIQIKQWLPDEEPRAIVLILHGLAEHSARYERFANAATANGLGVVTYDHRGHGPAVPAGTPAHFADRGGWNAVVSDVGVVVRAVRSTMTGVPVVLLGHSMGSYIAQSAVMRGTADVDVLILSGSTSPNRAEVRFARGLAWLISTFAGAASPARLLNTMSFGKFNDAFKPNRTEFDWLSRDPAEVDKYVDDPHCGQLASNRLWFDLLGGLLEIGTPTSIARPPENLPVLITGGELDPVGGASGMTRLRDAYVAAGLADVSLTLYPEGRHEILNETNRDDVSADLLAWIDAKLAST